MVYRLINSTYNVNELTLRLTRLLSQFIKADSTSIYLLDPEKKRIKLIASYDNKINILRTTKAELSNVSERERRVTRGYSIFEKHMIGLPMVADDNIGAVFVERNQVDPPFSEFDREMLSVVVEQSVTAIRNLQLNEQQQKVILGSIEFIGQLLAKQKHPLQNSPVYFKIAKAIAEKLGMSQTSIDNLYYASILHHAGAVDVPYEILAKTGQLTPAEFKIVRNLPSKSAEVLKSVEFLKPVLPIILYHREKYDGTGYPSGLKKEQIPLGARIMAVVDAYEAMAQGRPYKKKLSIIDTLAEIKRNSGTQFDPKVVDVLLMLSKQKNFRKFLSSTS